MLNNAGLVLIVFVAAFLCQSGSKAQFLSMTFASAYKTYKVIAGIIISAATVCLTAVIIGRALHGMLEDYLWARILFAVSFIFYGLWGMFKERSENSIATDTKLGGIATVALTHFIMMTGSRLQFAAITAAFIFHRQYLWILYASAAGIVVADVLGIIFEIFLARRLPYIILRLIASFALILFGLLFVTVILYNNVKLNSVILSLIVLAPTVAAVAAALIIVKMRK